MVRALVLILILMSCNAAEVSDIDDLSDDMRLEYLKFLDSMEFEEGSDTGTMVVAWKACYDTRIRTYRGDKDLEFQTSIARCIVTIVTTPSNQLN